MKHLNKIKQLSLFLLLGLIASGCNSTKYLNSGEKLLVKNTINIKKEKGDQLPPNLNYNLTTLYKQQPNTNWLFFFPSEKTYQTIERRKLEGKKQRKWRQKRAEPLAVYQRAESEASQQSMVNYLNNLGYFDAQVDFEEIPIGKDKIAVEYLVRPGKMFEVENLEYKSADPAIHAILQQLKNTSLLRGKKSVSRELFASEYIRMLKHLRNNGYAKMEQNYFRAEGDSTGNEVKVSIEVLTPNNGQPHQLYNIGEIHVYPNYFASTKELILVDSIIDGVTFKTRNNQFRIKPQTILENLFVNEGMLYDQRLINKTEEQLASLNSFRIISVQSKERRDTSGVMDLEIFLTPRKKLTFQVDLEANNSRNNISNSQFNLIGTSIRSNFKNYNAFKNATILDLALSWGTEFNLDKGSDLIYSADASGNIGFSVPRYIKSISPFGLLNWIPVGKDSLGVTKKLFPTRAYQTIKEKAKTTINIGYEYADVFQFYQYHSVEINFGYSVVPNKNTNIRLQQSGLTLFLPETTEQFDTTILRNEWLNRTFDRQLFTGLFFRSASYSHSKPKSRFGETWSLLGTFDLSGLEIFAANKLYNGISGNNDTLRLGNRINFSQFVKLELFANYSRSFEREKSFAARFNLGVARAFGYSKGDGVPFVEQFTGGGPTSMRGWRLRELGPGGFIQDTTASGDRVFFQSGDFKFEVNAELRFPIIGYLKGALFTDIGNIWTIRRDPTRPNSQFRFDYTEDDDGNEFTPFYDQIAIASGFGLRFDVNYFVIRLDVGFKMRNPYPINGSHWLPNWKPFKLFETPNYSFDIAYPF